MRTEVAIIGAGPAGLAAAGLLDELGCEAAVLDEQPAPGGQIYRGVGEAAPEQLRVLGDDYATGKGLLGALDLPGTRYIPGATVWEVSRTGEISYSVGGVARRFSAGQVILCTGATERPMPFPGWTLPGVMTAGAGQILLKTSGLLPPAPAVLAGSGPLLFLVAAQYIAAGHRIAAIAETTPAGNRGTALRSLPRALASPALLAKGLGMLARLRRAGIPHYRGATGLRAEGSGRVEALSFDAGGKAVRIDCSALLVHTGVVPNVQITRSLDLPHDWHDLQQCWHPRIDRFGRTEAEAILVAGDGAGIAGAEAAVHRGRLAALAVAAAAGRIARNDLERRAKPDHAALSRHLRARPFLDALYSPAPEFLDPPDGTVVCRCEEVTAGALRSFVDIGCLGPNQAKAFGRAGMGPCQGRYCGLTVSSVIAARRGVSPVETGYYRIRPPVKPVTLGELATMAETGDGDD